MINTAFRNECIGTAHIKDGRTPVDRDIPSDYPSFWNHSTCDWKISFSTVYELEIELGILKSTVSDNFNC